MTPPTTLGDALHDAARALAAVGIEAPSREARLLLSAATSIPPATILAWPDRTLDPRRLRNFSALLERRLGHEPISRILGRREFWSLTLSVTADVLDPRPETETLVEAVLDRVADRRRPLRIADLGTGSGAILLAFLAELPAAMGVGVDASEAALHVARGNARSLGLDGRAGFVAGDWAASIAGKWDIVVSNPPYLTSEEIRQAMPEVRDFDPPRSLDGGIDGLAAYRALIPSLPGLLTVGGMAALEVGRGQEAAVIDLLRASGLHVAGERRDLAGITRVLIATGRK